MRERLAIDGGVPVRQEPWPPWPHFSDDAIDAVSAVLRSGRVNYWTGSLGREFEAAFAQMIGRRHAVAMSNGTVALELALRALGVGRGDEVVVPARTFIATASAVVARGATPVVADVDMRSGNLSVESLLGVLTSCTKAVVVVHLAGWPADMPAIVDAARDRGLLVIEDCAQALGARIGGRNVGTFGDAATFSFCQDKIVTTGGEGGMLVTDDDEVFRLAWSYKDHGKDYDTVHDTMQHSGVDFRWLHERFGTNARMTEMQAALGLAALEMLESWLSARRAHAAVLDGFFADVPCLQVQTPDAAAAHAYYKYYTYVRPEALRVGWNRSRIAAAIAAEGVPCFAGACPEIQLEKAFDRLGPVGHLPVAQRLGETSLMFTVHPTLGEAELRDACEAVAKVTRVASGG